MDAAIKSSTSMARLTRLVGDAIATMVLRSSFSKPGLISAAISVAEMTDNGWQAKRRVVLALIGHELPEEEPVLVYVGGQAVGKVAGSLQFNARGALLVAHDDDEEETA
jgi:hypothetical protein